MGKKKKGKVEIKGSPLQAITIGEIKDHKYGWIGTLILFALFLGIVYYLPELFQLYQEYMGNGTVSSMPINNTNNTVDPIDEPQEIEKYKFEEKDFLEYDDFDISNIKLEDGTLTYTVTNKNRNKIDLGSYELYFELYNAFGDSEAIYYLEGYIDSGSYQEYSYSAPNSYIEEFSLRVIKEKDYTYFDLPIDSNKASQLTCEKDAQEIIYKFVDEELKEMSDSIIYSSLNSDYNQKYAFYSALASTNKVGIEASILTSADEFNYSMKIDYIKYTGKLENTHYFAVNSSPREVSFKMTALGFTCR